MPAAEGPPAGAVPAASAGELSAADRRRFRGWVGLVAGALVALVVAGHVLTAAPGSGASYTLNAVAAVAYSVAGALIVPRRSRNAVGWLFLAIGLANGLVVVAATYPGLRAASWAQQSLFPLPVGLVAFLLMVFPDGRLPSPRWRIAVWLGAGALTLSVAALGAAAWQVPDVLRDVGTAPVAVATEMRVAFGALVAVLGTLAAAVASLAVRWRRASGETRDQLKLLAFGGGVTAAGLIANFFLGRVWLEAVVGAALPVAAGLAILRYGLYDVDLALNRSLVYATLTVVLAGAYAGLVGILGRIFVGGRELPPLVATGIVAVLFQPLHQRVQRGVNRLLYGRRDEPYAVLSRLTRRLEEAADPATVLPRVVTTIAGELRLPYAAIELTEEAGMRPVAAHGRPLLDPQAFPMTHQGEVVGQLVVTARSSADPLTQAERALLRDVAAQAAAAANAVRLTRDLQRSRERLVRSREEERRRLRRDLHDGLGPALAGVTMQVGSARALLEADAPRADTVLGKMEQQLQACITEIRRVVEDLRPATLDRLGLVEAIRERVDAFAGPGGPEITLTAPDDLGELPAAVEVAAYRIALEGVTNVVRHAGARRCGIRLEAADGLVVEITDDGAGLPPDARPGVGLASMRERAEELGGTFIAERLPAGGSRVRAELPGTAR
ncbi:MAG: sensor histidine kinase [Actinomycetota bacterium]